MSKFISRTLVRSQIAKTLLFVLFSWLFSLLLPLSANAAFQSVVPPESVEVYEGEETLIELSYSVANEEKTNGLAFRIHFRSDHFDSFAVSSPLQSSLLGYDVDARLDASDWDGDPNTNSFVITCE